MVLKSIKSVILEKSEEGWDNHQIADYLKKAGYKKRTGKCYNATTISNYKSELRKKGHNIPKLPSGKASLNTVYPQEKEEKTTNVISPIPTISDKFFPEQIDLAEQSSAQNSIKKDESVTIIKTSYDNARKILREIF